MFMHKSKKGFTVVELVIVIAVIAVLAAVLIPTFSSLIKKANDSAYLQERTNQQIADLAEKVENQDFLSWADLEAKLAEELAKIETVDKAGVTDAIAKALANFENSLKTDDTALTEAQVKAIVEKALEGQLTTAQVEGIVKAAVKEAFPGGDVDTGSSLTADQVKTIVDNAVAGLNKETGITKEEMADAVAKAIAENKNLTADEVRDEVEKALAGFGYGNDPSIGEIQDIIDSAMGNAKLKADELAVKEMNEALAGKNAANIIEAAEILKAAGFNTEKGLSPVHSDYAFYWFQPTNQTVCVKETGGSFVLVYPEEVAGFNEAGCKSLNVAIEGVINAPVVGGTTAGANTAINTMIPDSVATFDDLMDYVTSGSDKALKCTDPNTGASKPGIAINGGNIKLTEDILLDVTNKISGVGNTLVINIYGNVTIDLNGYSITQKGDGQSLNLFSVRNGAALNIIDSSASKTGAIYASLGMFQIDAGATVNLFDGKLAVTEHSLRSVADVTAGVSIASMNGGTFNMYGGTIDSTSESDDAQEFAFAGYGVATSVVNIYNGTIVGNLNNDAAGTVNDLR